MDNSFLKKVFHKYSPEEEKEINRVKEESIIYKLINDFKLKLNPETGRYDCDGDVRIYDEHLAKIPIKFGKIRGDFDCSFNELKSLEGSPKEVGGIFDCFNNQLESLEGAPKKVGGFFDCSDNGLKSLEGAPKEVGGNFNCSYNNLKSLEGSPKEVGGSFYCSRNQLKSLEGAPKKVGGDFDCLSNPTYFTKEDVRKVCNVGGEIIESNKPINESNTIKKFLKKRLKFFSNLSTEPDVVKVLV